MSNKIFIDTSILIEALKGNKRRFYESLVSNNNTQLFLNSIVLSEYLYHLVGFSGGASPKSLQESNKLKIVLQDQTNQINILAEFFFIEPDGCVLTLAPQLMAQYNPLPNDAIILATCKIHRITQLASYDADFIPPCEQEGIQLVTETE